MIILQANQKLKNFVAKSYTSR